MHLLPDYIEIMSKQVPKSKKRVPNSKKVTFIALPGWGYPNGVRMCQKWVPKSQKRPLLTPAAATIDPDRAGPP